MSLGHSQSLSLLIMSTFWNTYKHLVGLATIAAVCPREKCERLPEIGAWLERNGMSVLHHPGRSGPSLSCRDSAIVLSTICYIQ